MKRHLWVMILLGVLFQLTGCATHTQQQSEPPVIEKSEPVAKPEIQTPVKPPVPVAPSPVTPQTKAVAPVGNAVASLITQARGQYAAKNYSAAVATAERGLRIDRRAAELYLVLAQSYVQLANTQLAKQFVQQGIRYSQAGSDVAQSLLSLRDSLSH
ncbi:MAG TPA: hypothetical protein VN030_06595 [Cellvibrio sp.]|nr:hypothetical protein [Cellvibrio sp.]